MQLAADRPDDLGQPPLDRHVDVLVVVAERERAAVELRLHALEPAEQRVAVGVGDDPRRREHRRVRARLLDVVGPEPPVEADRGVELAEDRVLGLREARHTGIMPAMDVVVRAARPDDPAARAALRVGGAVLRRLRRRRRAAPGGCCARSTRARGHTASWEVCRVAEAGGAVVGVLAALPGRARATRSRAASSASRCAHSPPWRIPRCSATCARPRPSPRTRRRGMLYVDALATDPGAPAARRGARAAGRGRPARGRQRASPASRSTPGSRTARRARSTSAAGFMSSALRPAPDERTARAVGGSGFVGYVKPR